MEGVHDTEPTVVNVPLFGENVPSRRQSTDPRSWAELQPLLRVRREGGSWLKTMIAMLMEWETRYLEQARSRRDRKAAELEVRDDDADLDMFGRPDEARFGASFDWAHFGFSMLRACFLWVFCLGYLFSSRFSWRAKLALVGLGLINACAIATPIIAYQWPPASELQSEPGLVWAPLLFYILIALAMSTVEGSWKDTGGSAASLQYLSSYGCSVRRTTSSLNEGGHRDLVQTTASDLVQDFIRNEQVRRDPWEYRVLFFVVAPVLGLIKAVLFILVDLFLVCAIPISDDDLVHFIFALCMFLNFVVMTMFLCLITLSAYIYRRQLLLLRLVAASSSQVHSSQLGIPWLPLRSVANVRAWSAMRAFIMNNKSTFPIGTANSMAGYGLMLTASLWVALLVSVFVDRSRALLVTPLNITLAYFALVLFYFSVVAMRQHVMLNQEMRSHSHLLGREAIRIQLAIELRGEQHLAAAGRVLKQLNDVLKLELSYFRLLGMEVSQHSMNSLIGLCLTLLVASLTNIVLDVGTTNNAAPKNCTR